MHRVKGLHRELMENVDTPRSGVQPKYPAVMCVRHDPKKIQHTRLEPQRSPQAAASDAPWDRLALEYFWREGFTVQSDHLQRYGTEAAMVSAALTEAFGHFTRLNLYSSPPQAQGFGPHFDADDVYIVQAAGTKQWAVYNRTVDDPTRDWLESDFVELQRSGSLTAPVYNVTLRPGDVLYIPRGSVHHADTMHQAADGPGSVHITVAVRGSLA